MRYSVALFLLLLVASCQAKTLIVDQNESGDAKTLSGAISMARSGDAIRIMPGNYDGAILDRRLIVIGSDESLLGSLVIAASGCVISNLTILASNIDPAISIQSQNNQLRRCTVRGRTIGVSATGENNTIMDCQVDSPMGFKLLGGQSYIFNSSFRGNIGIEMNGTSESLIINCHIKALQGLLMDDSTRNKIANNTFFGSGFGIVLNRSSENELYGNNFSGDYMGGIDVIGSNHNRIKENCITGGKIGISLRTSDENNVTENVCQENERAGIYGDRSNLNNISNNQLSRDGNAILLSHSAKNLLKSNNVSFNTYGISLRKSVKNTLRDNVMSGNSYSLRIDAGEPSSASPANIIHDFFIQDIDGTNLIEGRPVCYLVNKSNLTVPSGCSFVGLISCQNILVRDQSLSNSSTCALMVNSTNCSIQNSSIYFAETGVALLDCTSCNVEGCRAMFCKTGFSALESSNGKFKNNIARNCTSEGFHADNSQNLIFSGCNPEACNRGIYLQRCKLCIIRNCIANKNKEEGILLLNSHKCSLSGNEAFSNDRGISLSGSNGGFLNRNNASANNQDGISLQQLSKGDVLNNIAQGNGQGIYIQSAKEIMVKGNILCLNSRYGLRISNSFNCNATENSFGNNQIAGVNLVDSSRNILYHNIFANNAVQNAVDNGQNQWDAGSTIGGNYWSDFSVTGNPGNVPREIPSKGVDRYPFQDPRGWR